MLWNKKRTGLLVALVLILLLVAGCGGSNEAVDTGGGGGEQPSAKVETINWKLTTSWPTGIPLYEEMAVYFANEVDKLSNGRLKIDVFPAGSIAPALEVSEAVKTGIAQAGHLWPGYDIGKDRTAVLFGGYAGSPGSDEMLNWLYNGGGYEMWKEWRQEKFGIIGFPGGIRTREVFLHAHKPVQTLDDLKGMKIRTVGAWAEILPKLGASVVSLAGDEVLPALERKVIDGTEWATPGEDLVMGFHDVAKYIVVPGVHQPVAPMELVINLEAWNALSKDLQEIVEAAAKTTTLHSWTKMASLDMGAMDEYKEAGTEIIVMDPSVEKEARKYAKEWADEIAGQNEWFKKVLDSQTEYHEGWQEILPNR